MILKLLNYIKRWSSTYCTAFTILINLLILTRMPSDSGNFNKIVFIILILSLDAITKIYQNKCFIEATSLEMTSHNAIELQFLIIWYYMNNRHAFTSQRNSMRRIKMRAQLKTLKQKTILDFITI